LSALHARTGGQFALAAALVGTSLFASLLIVPNTRERAVMHLRDREFEPAREAFERRLAEDGPLLDVVVPLARLYAQQGELDRAIAILNDLLAKEKLAPTEIANARRLLALYLRWAGREAERRANLDEIARIDPKPQELRELSALHNFAGETEAQMGVLARLIALPDALADDYADLAELQAQRRRFGEAEATLSALARRLPERVDPSILDLWLSVSLEAKDVEGAIVHARQHLETRTAPPDIAAIVGAFGGRGLASAGLRALAPIAERLGPDPATNVALMRLAIDARARDVAADLFDRQIAAGTAAYAAAQLGDLVEIGFEAGRADRSLELARSLDLAALAVGQIEALAGQALDRRQFDFLRAIADGAGRARLADRPVLAARVYAALDEKTEAVRHARRAAEAKDLPLEDALALVQVFASSGAQADALALLSRVSADPALPESAVGDLAQLYLLAGKAVDAIAVFERLRRERPNSLAAATGWALAMAQAGRGEAVARWLEADAPATLPGPVLTDLFFIGGDAKSPALQLAAARRLRALEGPTPVARLRLAQAALAAGRAAEALSEARVLRPVVANDEVEALYRAALGEVAKRDESARAELRGYWRARLADDALVPASREEALYALIDAKAWDDVLPELVRRARANPAEWLGALVTAAVDARRLDAAIPVLLDVAQRADLTPALRREATYALIERTPPAVHLPALRRAAAEFGGEWSDALEAALERAGRREELVALLERRAGERAAAPETRRALAFRLLDLGEKARALAVFQALAAGAPASAPDAQQVLYLFGPRPDPAQIDWIDAQARAAATPADRLGWARALADSGAPRRAAQLLEADAAVPGRVGGPATAFAAEAYLLAGGTEDKASFARVLSARIAREGDPDGARKLAELAAAGNRADLARRAYERLLLLDPARREAQRPVGFAAFAEGEFERARDLLRRYLSGEPAGARPDWEAHYYLGESLYRLKDRAAARLEHERALAAIEGLSPAPFPARAVQAYLYHRLGRSEEAVTLYERLLREQPRNRDLRADYAGVLLELGRTGPARRVLEAGG
jgi:tetratricopeptide (TPR) repeat protein